MYERICLGPPDPRRARVWAQVARVISVREPILLGEKWPHPTRNNFVTKHHIVLQRDSNYSEEPTLQTYVNGIRNYCRAAAQAAPKKSVNL